MAGTLVLAALCAGATPARGGEEEILAGMRAFFETQDHDRREQLARQIEADPAFARDKVSGWLHRAIPFKARQAGVWQLMVPLADGQSRAVTLRIPGGYDAGRPWPLIYALHGSGGRGIQMIRYFDQILGDAAEQYVIAAPTGFGEVFVHDVWPPPMEHPAVLAALKRAVHVDSDRVFIMGYSRGGHAAWTLAVLHPDRFAGALPLAGTFGLPQVDQLWDVFLPNLANTQVLCVWGAQDRYGPDRKTPVPNGGIAGLNERLSALVEQMQLPIVAHEIPEQGHTGVVPPAELFQELLSRRRVHYPRTVAHTFRHIYQGRAYWIEGHAWKGPQWGEKLPAIRMRRGEDANNPEHLREALVRTFRAVLGELRGRVDGQTIDVRRKKVTELTIWIGDGMIDWAQPVTVNVSARQVYKGRLSPDLFVCLSQAARTYDFERLRWAGLRFKSGSKTRLVTGRTEFPALGGPP